MKKLLFSLFAGFLLAQFSHGNEAASDRKKVEFFEKLYKIEIVGVKPLEEYDDPDKFYSAIAKQVEIPKMAFDAVEKKFGWKQNDKYFHYAIVKGGWDADDLGVMVTRFPTALKTAKTKEEKMKLLKGMQMKIVAIGYDGTVTFPEKPKKRQK